MVAVIAAGTLWSGACASGGAVPRPFPAPSGAPVPAPRTAHAPEAPAPDGYAISSAALALKGIPYRNGGTDPHGFDCSGFTQYVFSEYGIALPRDVHDQFKVGTPVDARSLEPGDLLFFSTVARGASHVAIAIGGDEFVHAPSSNGVIRVDRLSSSYWRRRFIGARRIH
ncbi:MAG: C40 family peptidase [Betaproteobacteria bacterium]